MSLFGTGGFGRFFGKNLKFQIHSLGYTVINDKRFYFFKTALAINDVTTAPKGSIAMTSHATGRGSVFISDGSQWLDYTEARSIFQIATIATSGTTSAYTAAPVTGKLLSADFVGVESLAGHDSNYLTFSLTNLANSNAMLAVADANTTKATGGTGLTANTKRSLTKHGTAGNLLVTKDDRIRFSAAATGTPASSITGGVIILVFQRTDF